MPSGCYKVYTQKSWMEYPFYIDVAMTIKRLPSVLRISGCHLARISNHTCMLHCRVQMKVKQATHGQDAVKDESVGEIFHIPVAGEVVEL